MIWNEILLMGELILDTLDAIIDMQQQLIYAAKLSGADFDFIKALEEGLLLYLEARDQK